MRRTSTDSSDEHSPERSLERFKRILQSETGQMSVFVALIFQVLFVFFAMTINIGLIVHDKINLQNAVDLGAYYAAQKQAEILNEIAHINYQIRQDYKLLTWRYRVMGTLGGRGDRKGQPPVLSEQSANIQEAAWNDDEYTSVCGANNYWGDYAPDSKEFENLCYQTYDKAQALSPVLTILSGATFIPGIEAAAASSALAREKQITSCEESAGLNWALAMQFMYAYKVAVAGRRGMIQELRKRLVADANEMVDQNMQSVATGVANTIKNNLTVTNANTLVKFQIMNGLSAESCAKNDGEATLPEIYTAIALLFTNAKKGGCEFYQSAVTQYASIPIQSQLDTYDKNSRLRYLAYETSNTDDGKRLRSSLGFEKNPWCMAYMGVRAQTQPRKPFAPFGKGVVMEARAFAQPFGGRIGPWYTKQWARASQTSTGSDRVDPRTSLRVEKNGGATIGSNEDQLDYVPNYSRYPGDSLGLRSQAALASTRSLMKSLVKTNLKSSFYTVFEDLQTKGDPLVWDNSTTSDSTKNGIPSSVYSLRLAEEIAIAPDVFDATYYSIDPQYYSNYFNISSTTRFTNMPTIFGTQFKPLSDIGSRSGVDEIKAETVSSQMVKAVGEKGSGGNLDSDLWGKGLLNYFLLEWQHLLTGWTTNSATEFNFPDGKFGQCTQAAAQTMMVPGRCAYGGRVGYSVRLISRDHLLAENWDVGGDGNKGQILNPPSLDF